MHPWRNNYSYGDSGRSNNRLRCQLCDKSGHTAKVCRSRSHNHVEAKTHFVNGFQQHTTPWIVDSGASHHITSDANNFTEIQNYSGPDTIAMGDGNAIPISQTGKAKISSSHYQFNLQNTLCAPNIKRNLISVSQFCKDNLTSVEFFPSKFLVKDLASGAPLVCGQSKEGLYEWPLPVKSQPPQAHLVSQQKSLQLWHQRLGHPNNKYLKSVLNSFSIDVDPTDRFHSCNSCLCNKSHRLSFSTTTLQSTCPLQIIYSDLWGPAPILSVDNKSYYVLFVDQFTKYSWIFLLKHKNEVVTVFKNFQTLVENYFQQKNLLFVHWW